MRKWKVAILIGAAAVFCVSSLAFSENTGGKIVIGWTGPLSGNSAVLGIDSLAAVKQAIGEVNGEGGVSGCELEVAAEDDQYDTAKAVSAYSKLTSADKAVAVIASTYGGVFATANRSEKDRVPVIDPLDCNDDIAALPKHTLCLATRSESVADAIVLDIKARKFSRVAVLYDETNPFMVLVEKNLRSGIGAEGAQVLSEPYNAGAQNYSSFLTKVRSREIQALVLLGHDQMGQAMAESRKLGVKAQLYTVGTITSPGYQKLAGPAAEGALVAYWEAPKTADYQKFLAEFTKQAGRGPILELASVPSYDAAMLLIGALKQAAEVGCRVNSAKLTDALYETRGYRGLSGEITIDPDGAVRTIRERLYRFSKGKLEEIAKQ